MAAARWLPGRPGTMPRECNGKNKTLPVCFCPQPFPWERFMRQIFAVCLLAHVMLLTSSRLYGGVAEPVQTPVFMAGEDGYHTYRIPALIVSPRGTLLAFCEGRKQGGGDAGDIDLVLKRSSDNGKTWGALQVVW